MALESEFQLGIGLREASHRKTKQDDSQIALPFAERKSQEKQNLLSGEIKRVPLTSLNAIVQARNQYEDVDVLANAIKSSGTLLHTPFVAQFDTQGAKTYLAFVYGIYGDKVPEQKTVDDLVPSTDENGENIYLIVVAGHRRVLALSKLGEEQVDVKIKKDIVPLDALYIQAQENTQRPLTPDEQAEQHGRLWAVSKAKDANLTLEAFAKKVGVKPTILRRDLRYYSLPDEVKKYVTAANAPENKKHKLPTMPFNVACQLGRLVEAETDNHDILFLARRFFEENITSEKTASDRVGKYLRESKLNKHTMDDIFGVNAQRLHESRKLRQVAQRFVPPVEDAISYFSRIIASQKLGFSDSVEDGLAYAGAAGRMLNLADVIEGLLPDMSTHLSDKDSQKITEVFKKLKDISRNFQEIIPSENE